MLNDNMCRGLVNVFVFNIRSMATTPTNNIVPLFFRTGTACGVRG